MEKDAPYKSLLGLTDFVENGFGSRVGEAEFLRELIGHFHKIVF